MRRDPAPPEPDPTGLDAVECANLPAAALAALADLRREPGVTVTLAGERAWVRWPAGSAAVLRRVLPLAGAELYARREGHWYRLGHRLPAFGLPVEEGRTMPLARAVVPEPARPEPPGGEPVASAELRLVRDDRPRPASALRCGVGELARWADAAPAARIEALRAAWDGVRVLLRGSPLPPLEGGMRLWGGRVLVPLGLRPEPELPEVALAGALGGGEADIVVLDADGVEVVPRTAFRTLTRAGARLAARGGEGSRDDRG